MDFLLPTIPPGVYPWAYFLCVGLGVLITGVSKAGFGGGVGILAIPVMALVMGPTHMLGVMLPLLIACDIFSNLHHLGHYDWKRLKPLLAGIVIGIALGTAILWAMSGMPPAQFNRWVNGVVGGVCLAVVAMQVYRMTGRELPTLPPHPASGVAVGFSAGAVSTLNHSAGPIVTIYLLQEKLPKRQLVGTLLLYFLIGNTLKLPTYCLLPMVDGQTLINASTLKDSIWFIPLIPLGTWLGAWMHHRVPEKPFAAIMYIAAAVSAAQLVYKAAVGAPIPDPDKAAAKAAHVAPAEPNVDAPTLTDTPSQSAIMDPWPNTLPSSTSNTSD
jgi:uncharacterized membrane protein YfcA